MNTLPYSEIFFFISSIGFMVTGVLVMIFLYYFISAMDSFSRIMKKIEKGVDTVGDTTKELLEDVRESTIWRMFFGKKRKKHRD